MQVVVVVVLVLVVVVIMIIIIIIDNAVCVWYVGNTLFAWHHLRE